MEIDILIGKGLCSNCSPVATTKDESPSEKWGIIFKVEDYSILICIDCLQSFVDKAKSVKQLKDIVIKETGKGT